uniref:Myomesin-3-like n=1 Tax=Sinocyclocheilus rhinocerous TaxID=307959 RepID=A0A673JLD5_9TELE
MMTELLVILQAERKASLHMKLIEDLSMKAPDFPVPLRPHTVWTGMDVKLSCSVQGCPLPSVTCRVELQTGLRSTNLTLKRVHKEHEGLYSVRLRTWDGTVEHSAYVYVKDGPAVVVGAPGSPLQVKCSDVNRDYVFLSWIPPSADGAAAVQGYFIERCDIGVGKWERCNDVIQRECHYPVMGLKENTMYQFCVCAVNQAGVGRPSKPTDPILTSDPLEPSRTTGKTFCTILNVSSLPSTGQIRVPFPPTDMRVCELSDTYAVLSWTEPDPRGREPLTYFVERSLTGKESWHLASMDMTVLSTRFAAFDQRKGKSYTYRVRSVNKYGISEPSLPSEPISVGQPLGVPAPPHGVLSIRDTNSSVLLQWKEPKITEGIVGYYLYCSEVGSGQWKTINNKPITKTRFTVDGLKTNKEYVFRVKSVGLAGNSIYSEESPAVRVKSAICKSLTHVPSRPSAITLLRCTGAEMLIGWRAPANHGGDPVRGYFLDQREKSQSSWREISIKPAKERVYEVSLQEGRFYQFRVFAANIVGLGDASEPSELFLCERWTMPEPGCPYDLEFREVRLNSLVLLWAGPLYKGQSEVSGYVVEISEGAESEDWTLVTSEPVTETHLKVSGLQAGQTYRLRVSAVNAAGVGMSSVASEPVEAQTKAGTKEIEIGVDNDGFIFLSFEAPDSTDKDVFKWSKTYGKAIDAGRARLENKNNRSVLTFTDASEQDLGLYTVELSGNPDVSSSFTFTAEGRHSFLSLHNALPEHVIALKSEGWQVDVSEQGSVRLWLQTEALSSAAVLRLILNDREISSTPTRKINFDKAQGLVEILFGQISREDEGSYTAQLKDGRAKNQFTLVFVDKKFRDTLAKSEANRHNWKRKSGPHFEEFLSWTVTSDCEMIMKCKVTNVSKDTRVKWFKDGVELPQAVYEPPGVSSFTVPQVQTSHSQLHAKHEPQIHVRARQHIQENIRKTYIYINLDKRIDLEERSKPGSSMQKVWIEIFGPTENDKGKYTLEMFDGQETHKRSLDLSGQAFADALLEHQRLNNCLMQTTHFIITIHLTDRARVTKGLPDVVAIMEDKSLCLTCFAEGDPAPEMFWLKNDREVTSTGQYNIKNENKSSTLTINHVTMEDSGNYSIFVRNKHGSQTVLVTVSVYKHGEKPRADAMLTDGLEWCGLLVDYCDVFINTDAMLHFSKSDEETNSSTSWMD